jgi:hypothetical protein
MDNGGRYLSIGRATGRRCHEAKLADQEVGGGAILPAGPRLGAKLNRVSAHQTTFHCGLSTCQNSTHGHPPPCPPH